MERASLMWGRSVFLDGQEPHLALVARHGGIRAHPDGVEGRLGRGSGSDDDFVFPAFLHGHGLIVKGVPGQVHRGQVDGQFLGDGDFNGLGGRGFSPGPFQLAGFHPDDVRDLRAYHQLVGGAVGVHRHVLVHGAGKVAGLHHGADNAGFPRSVRQLVILRPGSGAVAGDMDFADRDGNAGGISEGEGGRDTVLVRSHLYRNHRFLEGQFVFAGGEAPAQQQS